MREKRLYWCPFCERNVSLWRTKDNKLICPRCGREVVYITNDGRIGAIRGKEGIANK
jgi:transcription initiation factor IIE alpha subunit